MLDVEKLSKHLANLEGLASRMLDEATIIRKQIGDNNTPNSQKKQKIDSEINAMLLRRKKIIP